MSTLLGFHRSILQRIHDPSTNDLLVLARGLGLRRIICTLMKIYDSPENLVLLVNASQEEESAIGEDLGLMGCRKPGLRVVGYEVNSKDRQELYKTGGLVSVTSRILVVDMLQSDIPTHLITGIIILHAEKVTALSLEAFIVRLYREKNHPGFLKAFTDQPEHITSGMSPLKNIMKELQLRNVHIYPRFHEEIKKSLERRRADVIELQQPLTESMSEIHQALVQCMNTTLAELKRSNTTLDLDDLNIESAYFRSFEAMVRRQLDPLWHKVGPKTKQLVNDLATLRQLLHYLLTYDPLKFHSYLETIITSNSTSATGSVRQYQSHWLLTDAADVIFRVAKRRCYTIRSIPKIRAPPVIDLVDGDDDEWDALDETQGYIGAKGKHKQSETMGRPSWLPEFMEPVLEELPKWTLLAEVLKEVEEEIMRQESLGNTHLAPSPGSNTVLIMTSSTFTAKLIGEFLSTMDPDAPRGTQGRKMMLRKLSLYIWWKGKLSEQKQDGKAQVTFPGSAKASDDRSQQLHDKGEGLSEAMKKKDKEKAERSSRRRRIRGGGPGSIASGSERTCNVKAENGDWVVGEGVIDEDESIAQFVPLQSTVDGELPTGLPIDLNEDVTLDFVSDVFGNQLDAHYGLLAPQQTVLLRGYTDDSDDQILAEIQPKFIVMFEPNMEFIRRIEVYRSSNPGLGVRVYHMVYHNCCEEHKYLAGIRREKESFERLIKERGSMLMPILEDRSATGVGDAVIKTISSRIAGGRRELNSEPSRVVVDIREFRSTLPSLLHASKLLVIPATLTVGDYILTPDICVERKSVSDLISSFNSGRLFTQCELMSVHYKQPILLIEFENDKAFSLETVGELKSYAKPSGKYPPKKNSGNPSEADNSSALTLQSKIVLLTLTFPRVRIIWASSPYATTDIFNDLKMNNPEPDATKAIAVGAEEDPEAGAGVNTAAEELLRCLPGISAKNVKYVMSKVRNVRELCEMDLSRVQGILGMEPGKACWEFMHQGERKR